MISLGCAKNLVDAEIMLGSVLERGMQITPHADEADVLVVNTCAFIDSAKEESIEAILEAHQQRELGKRPNQKLIVSGCMSQRFAAELRVSLPEVDAFIGLDQVRELGAIIERVLAGSADPRGVEAVPGAAGVDVPGYNFVTPKPTYIPDWDTPRFRLTPAHSVYLKIAEGCNHPCSFCVIPQMRGRHRSRPPASVLAEIRRFVAEGVKEINLISQDTTYYGMDLWTSKAGPRQPVDSSRGPTLAALLREIEKIDGDFWVRLLYTHPAHWSDELMETIAQGVQGRALCRHAAATYRRNHAWTDASRNEPRPHRRVDRQRCAPSFPESPCALLSSSVFRARRKRNSIHSSSSSNEFVLSGSGFSNTPRKRVRAPRRCPDRFPRHKKTLASGGP